MNRIVKSFKGKKKLLSIYFTAGFPNVDDTVDIIRSLQSSGVDMVEIGLPFSDPLADGPTIQKSSTTALNNGMTTSYLFNQLTRIRDSIEIPLIIMGYFNPILQFEVLEIPLDIFTEDWLLTLAEDGVLIGTNWNAQLEGKEVEPAEMAKMYLD